VTKYKNILKEQVIWASFLSQRLSETP
jgi:hypothetical protein